MSLDLRARALLELRKRIDQVRVHLVGEDGERTGKVITIEVDNTNRRPGRRSPDRNNSRRQQGLRRHHS